MEITIIGLLVCIIAMQIYNNQKRKKLQAEKEYLEQVVREDKRQYQVIAQANQNLKFVNHDLQKYMNVVREMLNDEYDGKLTGDDVVCMIFRQKEAEAQNKGIRFVKNVDGAFSWKLKNGELIRLFTNLLDNAIEAAEKVEHEPFVSIRIGVQETDNRVRIEMNNSKNPNEKPIEHDMCTSKSDKENHGYGMQIIREIVDKYDGCVGIEDQGVVFVMVVVV